MFRYSSAVLPNFTELDGILSCAEGFSELVPNSTFLVLTNTMLSKGIIDASEPVRKAFRDTGLHDYDAQPQGDTGKRLVKTVMIDASDAGVKKVETTTSLYRPKTKNGDPRLWVYSLAKYGGPGDVLALGVLDESTLGAVNLSRIVLTGSWEGVRELLKDEVPDTDLLIDTSLDRLIRALERVSRKGGAKAVCHGDTAVGRTMEDAIGIKMNPSKNPDWESVIELKFGRRRPQQRKNLVAKVPDWSLSPLKSSAEILDAFGYWRDETFKLYTEVSANPNSQGLYLTADPVLGLVHERSTLPLVPLAAVWKLKTLQEAILLKHNRTCWVTCSENKSNGVTYFSPKDVTYTSGPRVDLLPLLIAKGDITLDHLIKRTSKGVHEKGPLWKVKPRSAPLLLPVRRRYEIRDGAARLL